ncbi:hypothetical protein BURKHO8Y_360002 [Burkholderia sp. 8Y]|nr:hypothetical protein BURKHO8Y_360002 [Burkholderia sp. 8Y]
MKSSCSARNWSSNAGPVLTSALTSSLGQSRFRAQSTSASMLAAGSGPRPNLTLPISCSCRRARSRVRQFTSKRMRRARSATICPAGFSVMPRLPRSHNAVPASASSAWILRVSAGCERCTRRAAAASDPASATAIRCSSRLKFKICVQCKCYIKNLQLNYRQTWNQIRIEKPHACSELVDVAIVGGNTLFAHFEFGTSSYALCPAILDEDTSVEQRGTHDRCSFTSIAGIVGRSCPS